MAQSNVPPTQSLKIVGVIPARMGSERLPGKVLRDICGLPMVHRVYNGARESKGLSELWIATESERVLDYCAQQGIPVLMTGKHHQSGTERINEVAGIRSADVYVNIQGDEPMLRGSQIDLLIEPFLRDKNTQVSTLMTKFAPGEEQSPNAVKVVTGRSGYAIYFSRSPIPFRRNADSPLPFYKHLGFYAYTREALSSYCRLEPAPLETTERLEQLRFLENGIPIFVAETPFDTVSVDTEEDLARVVRKFEEMQRQD